VSAYKIMPVTNLDEIAHHHLSTVVAHLTTTRGPLKVYIVLMQQNGDVKPNQLQTAFGVKTVHYDHLKPLQNQILNIGLQYEPEINGASVDNFVHKLRGIAGEEEIRYF
jgi:hypothetical protein